MRHGQIVEALASINLTAQRAQADYTRVLMQASVGFQRTPAPALATAPEAPG